MPAYNAEKYIAESIESILSQTFTDFEFIIINDASTDSTKEIIESFQDSRIILINNEQNLGVAKSLNIGIATAKGKYIARMDADDISLPERFQTQFNFMEKNPDIDICGSWTETFGDNQCIIKVPEKHNDIKDELFFSCSMLHPTVIFKKNLNLQYFSDFPRAEDYDLWCRKINDWNFANIPEVLLLYRIHENQIGMVNKAKQVDDTNYINLRNLQDIDFILSEEEKQIYIAIINGNVAQKNKKKLFSTIKMLDDISKAGEAHGYKQLFQDKIRIFIKNIAEHSLQNKATSIKLYFTTFRKWKIFETPRANMRYIYYCLTNILHIDKLILYTRDRYKKAKRLRLKNIDFSLIASNCNGAMILHDLNLRFNSPFVDLWIKPQDFIKMCRNLKDYMNCNLHFTNEEGINYPVGIIKDIRIYFQHYQSEQEAENKWNKRKQRINYDNIFILFTDRDGCTKQDLIDFDNLKYKNKAVFVHKPIPDINSAVYIRGFEQNDSVGMCMDYKGRFSLKRYYDDFDYVSWLNKGTNK